MENIVSGWQTRVTPRHRKSFDKKGYYYVRFFHYDRGRYCYVDDGDVVSWFDVKLQRRVQRCVSTKNSEKYYIYRTLSRDTQPGGNYDIGHFIVLEDGKILAVALAGKDAFEISEEEYRQEGWLDG